MFGNKREVHEVPLRVITRSLVITGRYRTTVPSLRYSWGVPNEGQQILNSRLLVDATSSGLGGESPVTSPVVAVTYEHIVATLLLDPEVASATADDYASALEVARPVTIRGGVVEVQGTALFHSDPFPADGDDTFHNQFLYPVVNASVQMRGEATWSPTPVVLVHRSGIEAIHPL